MFKTVQKDVNQTNDNEKAIDNEKTIDNEKAINGDIIPRYVSEYGWLSCYGRYCLIALIFSAVSTILSIMVYITIMKYPKEISVGINDETSSVINMEQKENINLFLYKFIYNALTFDYNNINKKFAMSRPLMSTVFAESFELTFGKNFTEKVKLNKMVQVTEIDDIKITDLSSSGFKAEILVTRALVDDNILYSVIDTLLLYITADKIGIVENNPYGFVITGIKEKPYTSEKIIKRQTIENP